MLLFFSSLILVVPVQQVMAVAAVVPVVAVVPVAPVWRSLACKSTFVTIYLALFTYNLN